MKKEKLESLRALVEEINTLQHEYNSFPSQEYVGDTAKDYSTGKGRTIVIQGYSSKKSEKLAKKIETKVEKLKEELLELEDYLDSVQDPEMRDILRLYYAKGLSQEEIGARKGYTRGGISSKMKRFFDKE